MQTRRSFSKGLAFALLIGTLVVIAAIWNAARVKAFNPQPDPPAVVFGITRDQTARLNAFNSNSPGTSPITAHFVFQDVDGGVLAQSTQAIEGGHAVSFDLNGATLSSAFEPNRVQIVGEVKLQTPPPDSERTRVPIVASAEVFDNAGIDAGKTRMGWTNHNETLKRDTRMTNRPRRMKRGSRSE